MTAGERPADFGIGSAPHDHRVAGGQSFKPGLFAGDLPGDAAVVADEAVAVAGGDEGDHSVTAPAVAVRTR